VLKKGCVGCKKGGKTGVQKGQIRQRKYQRLSREEQKERVLDTISKNQKKKHETKDEQKETTGGGSGQHEGREKKPRGTGVQREEQEEEQER